MILTLSFCSYMHLFVSSVQIDVMHLVLLMFLSGNVAMLELLWMLDFSSELF